eukprot:COSAG01_NODE_197_length_22333_cov_45.774759_24_plen_230_part_00
MPDGQRGGDQSGRTGKKTARGSRGGQGVAKRAQAGAGKAKTPMMQSQQAQQKRASSMGGGGGGAKKGGAGAGGGGQVDVGDAISSVYDWHQKQGLKMPTYTFEALGSQGPFECTLTLLDGSEWRGRGKKKSEAKASASREALRGGLDKALARRAANLTRGISGGGVGGRAKSPPVRRQRRSALPLEGGGQTGAGAGSRAVCVGDRSIGEGQPNGGPGGCERLRRHRRGG